MSESVELLIEDCSVLPLPESGTGERADRADSALRDSEISSTPMTVAVADGRIVAAGPARELAGRFRAAERIPANGRLLTPGFVDSHTHLVFAGDRSGEFAQRAAGDSYEAIAAAGGGIRASVRATRAASEDELFALARPRVERMLAAGTTTIEIKSGYGLDLETELRMLRVIRRLDTETAARVVPTFCGAHEIPDESRNDRNGFVDLVCEAMIPRVAEEGLACFNDVFCEENVFTPEESRRVLECGKQHGLAPKIHADELAASGGSRVAAEVGATSADHLMMIGPEDIAGLARTGVVPTLLPGTTFYLGKSRYAPARDLLAAGLPVALATDRNPGSCTIEKMPVILGLACQYMGMSPLEAFRGATVNGARALALADRGRLTEGQMADLVLWSARSAAQVVYEFANDIPRTVFVGGQRVAG